MQFESITIKDIAKALNLSNSTVSRALKGSYHISEETRKKVNAFAREHNYRPNLNAQSLKNKKSRSIGLILDSVHNTFYAEVINGIESVASEKDYHVIITQSHESYEKELKNLEHLLWRSVDGLLISLSTETKDTSRLQELYNQGFPVVFFDRDTDDIETHKVVVDNAGGAYDLTTHLVNQGFRRIAHITSHINTSITKERLAGYTRALTENNIAVPENYIKYCAHGGMLAEEVEQALDELMALPKPPDAIFTASDRLTIKCFSLLHEKGIKIPQQVALGGFSNFGDPQLFCPPLTTIKQPTFDIGRKATELLIQLIEAKRPIKEFERCVYPAELVVRKSTLKKKA